MRDFRLAFRQLIARPGFSLVAILSLAIGIGANSTMFSLTDALVLRPLPVEDHERLLRLYSLTPRQQDARISYADYRDYASRAASFTGLAAGSYVPLGLGRGPEAPPVSKLGMAVYGRLKPGVTTAQAQHEMRPAPRELALRVQESKTCNGCYLRCRSRRWDYGASSPAWRLRRTDPRCTSPRPCG